MRRLGLKDEEIRGIGKKYLNIMSSISLNI